MSTLRPSQRARSGQIPWQDFFIRYRESEGQLRQLSIASAPFEEVPSESYEELRRALDDALGNSDPVDTAPLHLASRPDFTRRVLKELTRIPPGETRSYGEVARLVNCPGGARAVGQAVGSNPFPPLIPCHRVIRSDGGLGGYGAGEGTQIKRSLLRIEGARI